MRGGWGSGGFLIGSHHAVEQAPELQVFEYPLERFLVRLLPFQPVHIEADGYIGLDGGKEFGEQDLFAVGFYLGLDGTFQLTGMFEQVFDASELGYQFLGSLFAHARASGDVVGGVAHQPQHINDLSRRLDVELGFHFRYAHHFEFLVAVFGTVHEDVVRYQLPVVFIGRHHVSGDALPSGFGGKGSDDVIGFVSAYLKNGDAVGTDDVFYNRHRETDDFGCFFTLGFVLFVSLVAERGTCRVEGDSNVCGLLFLQHIFQCIDEAHDGGSIESLRVDTGIFDESIVCPVNQSVCVQ